MHRSEDDSTLRKGRLFLEGDDDLPMKEPAGGEFKLAFDPLAGHGEVGSEFMMGNC